MYKPIPGEVYRWTRNHTDHPDEPEYNYFIVLSTDWGIRVKYLLDGKETTYTDDTFERHKEFYEKV